MLLEPLKLLKQADAQLNMTQGTLGGVGTYYVFCDIFLSIFMMGIYSFHQIFIKVSNCGCGFGCDYVFLFCAI